MTFLLTALLERTAARLPHAVAIAERDRTLTYGELDVQSAALAAALRRLGVGRGDRVGIFAKKTARSVISMFGILRAGAAYVPLDPSAPASRVAYAIENAGVRVLVTSRALLDAVVAHGAAIDAAILVDEAPSSEDSQCPCVAWHDMLRTPRDADAVRGIDTDLAYVLYTSGSTGVPKGVAIDHRASMTFVTWAARRFALDERDRVTSHAPLHFDLSTFDIFATVAAGATIVMIPDGVATFPPRLSELLARERITVTYLVPSALSMMIEHGDLARRDLSALRAVLFAGEVFQPKYLRAWLERAPSARFYNLYGPTETNVCTYLEVDRDDALTRTEPVTIGAPIDNVDAFAIDANGQVVTEAGGIGELWVRGACLARGYFGDAEKTARSFVASPIHAGVVEPAYRTGDRVQLEPDLRSFKFLGRVDHLIKTRGYRVELGEIESTLAMHPGVAAAVAVPVPDDLVGHLIRAFVTLVPGASLAAGALESFCSERLPRYMIPESIDIVSSMPLTSSGKIDRRALVGDTTATAEEAAE